jgi:hypothetical protein
MPEPHRVARRGWPSARAPTRTLGPERAARRGRARAGHESSRRARMVRLSRTLSRPASMTQPSTLALASKSIGQSRGMSRSLIFAASSLPSPEPTVARGRSKKKARAGARAFSDRAWRASLRIAPFATTQDQAGGEKCESEQDGHQQRDSREWQGLRASNGTGGRTRRLPGYVVCRRHC